MQKLINIALHHTGGYESNYFAKTSNLTERDINESHKLRWPDFPSQLNGSFIGYNAVIYADGTFKQYRYAGEETAAQKGHNLDTFSICLVGNFTKNVELPTVSQRMRLNSIIRALIEGKPESVGIEVQQGTTLSFSREMVYPHRVLQPNHTECYGNALSDAWGRDFVVPTVGEQKVELLTTIIELYKKMIELIKIKRGLKGRRVCCFESDVRN